MCLFICVCVLESICKHNMHLKNTHTHTHTHTHTKQERQMLKWSIFAKLAGLIHSHLPYIINTHKHMSCFMQLYNRMTAQGLAFPSPCDLEWTLKSFKLESNSRVHLCCASHHTKFEKKIGSQVSWQMTMLNVYSIKSHQQSSLNWKFLVHKKFSMYFSKLKGSGNRLNWQHFFVISYTTVSLNEC